MYLLPVLENVKAGHTCTKCHKSINVGDLCVVYFDADIQEKVYDEVYHEICASALSPQMSLADIAEAVEYYISSRKGGMA